MSKNIVTGKMTEHNAEGGIFYSFFTFSDTDSATKLIIQTDHTNVKHKKGNLPSVMPTWLLPPLPELAVSSRGGESIFPWIQRKLDSAAYIVPQCGIPPWLSHLLTSEVNSDSSATPLHLLLSPACALHFAHKTNNPTTPRQLNTSKITGAHPDFFFVLGGSPVSGCP